MENMDAAFKWLQISRDPKAYSLMKKLKKKLSSSFLTEAVQKEADESRQCFNEAVRGYFKYRIIMEAVVKTNQESKEAVVKTSEESKEAVVKTSEESKEAVVKTSEESIEAAVNITQESENEQEDHIPSIYLNAISSYATKYEAFLPFTAEHVADLLRDRKLSKSDIEEYSIQVENKIAEFCIELSKAIGKGAFQDWRKQFAYTLRYISSKADYLDLESSNTQLDMFDLQEMYSTYYTELTEGLTFLKEILNLLEKKYNFQLKITDTFLLDCQDLLLSLQHMEMRLLNDNYNEKNLPALRMISEALDGREEKAKIDRAKVKHDLKAYRGIRRQLRPMAYNYQQLLLKLKCTKWTISILQPKKKEN